MRNFVVAAAGFTAIIGSMFLAACAPLQQQIPILSLLTPAPRPPALALRAESIPSMPRYRPVSSCQYSARMSDGITTQTDSLALTIRRVRDRLLVTSVVGAEQSTALISQTGRRYDFNAADNGGPRLTPEELSRVKNPNGPAMNNIDLFIPSYISGPISPGQVVSQMSDSSGTVQAAFVYRGLATFHDREVILLDLVRSSGGNDVGRTIGFSIVDRERALPLLFAAGGNPSMRSEQTDCRD